VSFHGNLDTPNPALAKKYQGQNPDFARCHRPPCEWESILAFPDEMEDARVDYQFIAYSGAVHSFTDAKRAMIRPTARV
jgi:dienelactone hydrolase